MANVVDRVKNTKRLILYYNMGLYSYISSWIIFYTINEYSLMMYEVPLHTQ
jgi:hypothetical protein